MNRLALALLALLIPLRTLPAQPPADERDWAYLDNGQIRLGVKRSSGAGIAFLAPSGSARNLIDHYDRGRLVQQSYYGDPDGSLWDQKPWRWNPVQGGDWRGNPSRLLDFRAKARTLYAKVEPRHWASGAALADVVMEQWITLQGRTAHVRFKMTYSGTQRHQPADQEVPACFTPPDLKTLVLYDGPRPWTDAPLHRSEPGWPNESRTMTEHWAAYVDANDFGVGAYVPTADRLTCYRYREGASSCSYFAPLVTFAIGPGTVFEYDLYLTVGTSKEIRAAFRRIASEERRGVTSPRAASDRPGDSAGRADRR